MVYPPPPPPSLSFFHSTFHNETHLDLVIEDRIFLFVSSFFFFLFLCVYVVLVVLVDVFDSSGSSKQDSCMF